MAALITILVLLVSCSALVLCNQSPRFTFDRSALCTARITTCISTESYVYHMEIDQHEDGNILFSDQSSLKTTDSKETKTIAGRATEYEYREGAGEAARFRHIAGFYQISSRKVVVVDRNNHCLRLVDRLITQTQTFSGTCTKYGYADGSQALFFSPMSIIPDSRDQDKLLVTDRGNNAVRHVDINTGVVSTFFKDIALNGRAGITQDVSSGDLFLTTKTAVYHLHYQSKEVTLITGSPTQRAYRDGDFSVSWFSDPQELLLIDNMRKLLVTDLSNHRLRILDRQSNMTYSLCTGAYGHTDGDMNSCSLNQPLSLMVSGDSLYIGEYQRIRIMSDIAPRTLTCPDKIVALTSPETGLATFQFNFRDQDHSILFPLGRYPYIINSSDLICNTTLEARDYRVRHTLELVADYTLDCSVLNSTVTRSLLEGVAMQKYSIIDLLCDSVCKKPGNDARPVLSCDGVNNLQIRWPTDLVLPADLVSVPTDIRQVLETRIKNRGLTLNVVVFGASPPIVYPTKAANGGYVSIALSTSCINGLIYSDTEDKCV